MHKIKRNVKRVALGDGGASDSGSESGHRKSSSDLGHGGEEAGADGATLALYYSSLPCFEIRLSTISIFLRPILCLQASVI